MAIGKKLAKAREGIDREHLYSLDEAIKMVKERAKSKFDETIEIAKRSGAPAEIYHLKVAGKQNWGKLDDVIKRVEAARAIGPVMGDRPLHQGAPEGHHAVERRRHRGRRLQRHTAGVAAAARHLRQATRWGAHPRRTG